MKTTTFKPTAQPNTRKLTQSAMLAAIAAILMYIELPMPFMPPFLKIDLSGVPVLIAAFAISPLQGVAVAFVKDIVHLLSTQTGGVGELSDFLILGSFAFIAGHIYQKRGDIKLACFTGSVAMVAIGAVTNLYLIIPFYSKIMPIEAIIAACAAVNPAVNSLSAYILFGATPFNIIKATLISLLAIAAIKRLAPALRTNR